MGNNGQFKGLPRAESRDRRPGLPRSEARGRRSVTAWITVPPNGWRTLFVEADRSDWIETKGSFAVAMVTLCFGFIAGAVLGFAVAFFSGALR